MFWRKRIFQKTVFEACNFTNLWTTEQIDESLIEVTTIDILKSCSSGAHFENTVKKYISN